MSLLEVRGITKIFGGLEAVKDVSFQVEEGQIFAIIGPNGAGKTTIFNMLSGLLDFTSGNVSFGGRELHNLAPHRITALGIGRTFQNIRLFGGMTVLDNVIVGYHCRTCTNMLSALLRSGSARREWKSVHEGALELLKTFSLEKYKDELASNLPYGQQRWLEIARAIASEPRLILLDEPAAGLNIAETETMMHQISWLRSELKKTVLLIEHDMRLVMGISDYIVVLDHGRQIAEGKPAAVQSNQRVIEAYLGKGYIQNGC